MAIENKRMLDLDGLTRYNNRVRAKFDDLQSQVSGLASGSPLVASSTAEMTDTSRVYVNTTDGHWYYWNGSVWSDGGVYQSSEDSEEVDKLKSGVAGIDLDLSPIATYYGYWQGNITNIVESDTWYTYKYRIPEGTTKLKITSKFYGIMGIMFTDIEDPTVTFPNKYEGGNVYMNPYSPYASLEERTQTFELERYYKYVYVPSYAPYGTPPVVAYRNSAIEGNWLENNPLNNKKILFFGDSITYNENYYRRTFYRITRAKEIGNFSYPGAHLADYRTDVPLNGNYTDTSDGGVHNVVCNQVYYWLNNAPDDAIPDIIIISAGTNDVYTSPSQLETDVNVYATTSGWIDVDTIDRTTFEGAMRWITSKLRTKYPNAAIVFASPIQSAQNIGVDKSIDVFLAKEAKMRRACDHLSAKLIEATSRSGITGEFESNGTNGRYLIDGLHPNTNGGNVLGTFYANSLISMFSKKLEWDSDN